MIRRDRLSRAVVAAIACVAVACADTGDGGAGTGDVTVVVSAPLTGAPWVGEFVERGARLAVEQVNESGGVQVGDTTRRLRLRVLDHGGSARTALAHARRAAADGAAMLIGDGTGALAVAEVTDAVPMPYVVTFEGGTALVDEDERPTLFRLAPANRPMTMRLADYLAEKSPRLAVLHDDTTYGRDGARELAGAIARNRTPVVATVEIPAGARDVAPQVLRARRSGADTVIVWARSPIVAAVVRAARGSGWDVPLYTGPTGEDPFVRQQLADRPQWLDGLTFVSFRITAEIGPEPWEEFRSAYERRFGRDEIGVTAGGRPVVMPPDWAMYSYDAVRLLAAALERAGGLGRPLIDAMNTVAITGANGDERSFGPQNHEGVSQDDMYFGRFSDMRFVPVTDDILSTNLPPVPQ